MTKQLSLTQGEIKPNSLELNLSKNFTKKEKEILLLLIRGKSAKTIGILLHRSQRTIEHAICNMKLKADCYSKSELIDRAVSGLVKIIVNLDLMGLNMEKTMKRIVKKPEVRRAEIIQAAKQLFEKIGYERTSVEEIIKEAGIAKGTFYYYFTAKQDILKAIVEQTGKDLEAHFKSIIEMTQLTAIEKLKLMIRGPQKQELVQSQAMELIHKPENRQLQEELNKETILRIVPYISMVFKQGYAEGFFKKAVSDESIELVIAGSLFLLDSGLFDWSTEKQTSLLRSIQHHLELLSGATSGSLEFVVS